MKRLRVGLLGCGNVGAGLVALLGEQRAVIAARTGIELEISRIAVRSASKDRGLPMAPSVFCDSAADVVTDPEIDVVVEVIGGIEPARTLLRQAIDAKKPVVTANKELLANHGAELFGAADEVGVDLLFEAAVAGAIPLIRPLRESLAAEPLQRIMGIVNGTTNYILTQMSEHGAGFDEALSEAQSLGYAESDPSADVEGFDAAAKAAIIATVAFGVEVVAGDVYHEGITRITPHDIEMARRLGFTVKAVAVAERATVIDSDDPGLPEVAVRVHPAMVPLQHPLAGVRDSFNAVFVQGDAVGELMFYGRGAGGRPTAGAVLGDLVDAAVNLSSGASGRIGRLAPARIRSIDDLRTAYYLSLEVADKPGVLASVAAVFGRHGVSIRSMQQHGLGDDARLVFITHQCRERDLRATQRDLSGLREVHELGNVIRVIGEESRPR
ncbi:MAG: homoserine dehydrogenase [Acidimicrobiaceae bacterium]|nr:homoserine dehydrogenase [Acidimicrobiaceae bacterium]MCY4280720.1 homoserine dehydrogenase [Acidimicrobiaceae bacterium]MCY4294165.1 homoserine dehydrogenase [Acidimicrobiaceae bacterium]